MFDIEKLNVHDDIWSEIENSKGTFEKELYKEINKGHILYGIKVKEVAHREDCDDVLFLLMDGTNRYAVVHLTWNRRVEDNSSFPKTNIYDNLIDLINAQSY